HHRKFFAGLHGLLVVNLAMLAGRDVQTDFILVLQHDPIAADILDSGFRITGHNQMGGSEIAPAVPRMPARHREFSQIDLVAMDDIFENRSSLDDVSWNRLHGPTPPA